MAEDQGSPSFRRRPVKSPDPSKLRSSVRGKMSPSRTDSFSPPRSGYSADPDNQKGEKTTPADTVASSSSSAAADMAAESPQGCLFSKSIVENLLEPKTKKGVEFEARRNARPKENRVQVAVRVRPMSRADGGVETKAVTTDGECIISVTDGNNPDKKFTFDNVFEGDQNEVYDCIGRPMLSDAIEGFNVTLFAYGQTGSGKTYSIQGELRESKEKAGVVPRFCEDLLVVAQKCMETDSTLLIKIGLSMIELYNERVRDLLEKKPPGQAELTTLDLHEDKNKRVYVEGLSRHTVTGHERLIELIRQGLDNRQMHETNMNATSSRSHSIVQILLTQTHDPPRADAKDVESLINIVDLAGSERQTKTGATGDRFEEAKKINHSLLMLGRALNTFADGKAEFVPLRESKLTRLLSESFGGNARTWMLACCSPSVFNITESLSTLQYAQNAKSIVNKAKVNALQEKLELKQLKLKYAQLEKLYDDEKEKSKQLKLELQGRAELIQQLQAELRTARGAQGISVVAPEAAGNYFIGRAHLSLKNIIQLQSNYVTLPLITDNADCDGALLMVSTYPLKKHREQQSDEGISLEDLLGKRIDLIVHVIGVKNIPEQFSGAVYCKYVFKQAEKDVYQTETGSGKEVDFDFKKRYAFGSLTQQLADYLSSANVLTFEVIGERNARNPQNSGASSGTPSDANVSSSSETVYADINLNS